MLRFLSLLMLIAWSGAAGATSVSEMRLVGDMQRTRFIVDLAEKPDFGIIRLTNPYRLVIDMPNVEFGPPKPGKGRGLITDFRYGLIAPGKARIVLDLNGPADVVKTFILDAVGTEPARLVVDIAPTSADAFAAAALKDRPAAQPEAAAAAELPLAPGPRATPGTVVVIDPGHGGIDSGARGTDGLLEKDVTLAFATELARQLNGHGKVQAVLTRDSDTFLALRARVDVAREHQAALFISVHADTVNEKYVRGATVYTVSDKASDSLSAALAARENRSDILAGFALDDQPDDVADILFDLARRETKNLSVRFAQSLVTDLDGTLTLNKSPWRRAAFVVLKAPDIPSVLLELGYLSNSDDEKLFHADNWQVKGATTVAAAIEAFVGTNVAGQ